MKAFVAMPFGTRRDVLDPTAPEPGPVELNFDDIWAELFAPAIPEGWDAVRADGLSQPGLIDKVYIEELLTADVVLADITFGNPNVFYELGIRQALSDRGTLLVNHRGNHHPFDVRNQTILEYVYVGGVSTDGIKFQRALHDALVVAAGQQGAGTSPVHVFLPGLFVARYEAGRSPQVVIQDLQRQVVGYREQLERERAQHAHAQMLERIREAATPQRLVALARQLRQRGALAPALVEPLAIKLRRYDRPGLAIDLLTAALDEHGDDPALMRELGFCHRLSGGLDAARSWFERALALMPDDPELLGMTGGLHRRSGNLAQARDLYERAVAADPEDLYPRLALSGLLVQMGEADEATKRYLDVLLMTDRAVDRGLADHWVRFARGEARIALGNAQEGEEEFRAAMRLDPPPLDTRSEIEQLEVLLAAGWHVEATRRAIDLLSGPAG